MKKYMMLIIIIISLLSINVQGITNRYEDFYLNIEENDYYKLRVDLFKDFDLIDIFIESNQTFDIVIISQFKNFQTNISYLENVSIKYYNNIVLYNDTISWDNYDYYIYNPNNESIIIHYIIEGRKNDNDNNILDESSIVIQISCCSIIMICIFFIPIIIIAYYLIKKGKKNK